MMAGAVRTLAVVALWIGVAHAEPDASTSERHLLAYLPIAPPAGSIRRCTLPRP
jgi:hypothetical protein